MSLTRRAALSLVSSVAVACGGGLLEACGDATGGARVRVRTRVVAASLRFDNALGWSFVLTRVALSIGPLYWFDGEPLFGFRWVRAAHAHPGHYHEGNALGQALARASVDLAQGAHDIGSGEGLSGTPRSGRVTYHAPPIGSLAALLGDRVVHVEGVAARGAERRSFVASATLDEVGGAVDGCSFVAREIVRDGRIVLTVKPSIWLEFVDVPVEGAAQAAFVRGLRKATAYVFSYEEG